MPAVRRVNLRGWSIAVILASLATPVSARPTARGSDIVLTGAMTPDVANRGLRQGAWRLRSCLAVARTKDPRATGGSVRVRLTVNDNGNVEAVETLAIELASDIAACVVPSFQRFRFAARNSGAIEVTYTIR